MNFGHDGKAQVKLRAAQLTVRIFELLGSRTGVYVPFAQIVKQRLWIGQEFGYAVLPACRARIAAMLEKGSDHARPQISEDQSGDSSISVSSSPSNSIPFVFVMFTPWGFVADFLPIQHAVFGFDIHVFQREGLKA